VEADGRGSVVTACFSGPHRYVDFVHTFGAIRHARELVLAASDAGAPSCPQVSRACRQESAALAGVVEGVEITCRVQAFKSSEAVGVGEIRSSWAARQHIGGLCADWLDLGVAESRRVRLD